MVRKGIIILCLTVLVFPLPENAQQPGIEVFAHYSSENGLPQNSINGMIRDKKGFVWIATNSGLVRFDGHNFRVFNMVDFNPKASNRVNYLVQFAGKIYAMEGRLDKLFEIVDENTIRTVSRDSIPVIQKMGVGHQRDPGLEKYRSKNFSSHTTFICDSSGRIGYAEDSYTREINYYHYPAPPVKLNIFSWREMNHTFVIGTRLYAIDHLTRLRCFESGREIPAGGSLTAMVASGGISGIKESRFLQTGFLVYMTTGSGFYRIHETAPGIVNAELFANTVNQQDITAVQYLPEQQILMLGTGNEGLYMYRKRHFSVLLVPEKLPDIYERSRYLFRPNNNFYPVAELNDSTVLTNWGGLTFSRRIIPAEKVSFQERMICSPAPGLFLATKPGSNELVIIDRQFKEHGFFDPVNKPAMFRASASERDTFYIQVNSNSVWHLQKYLYQPPNRFILLDTYPDSQVGTLCMVKLPGKYLYLGTEKGCYSVDLENKKTNPLSGLEQAVVRTFYKDSSNKIWIGTYGKGWYLLDNGKLKKLYSDRNACLENVHAFLEDDKGYLWVTTNNGLFRFLKADLEKTNGPDDPIFYNYFTREYGFLTNEFNGGSLPSALRMSNGKFVFPGMNGLVVFDPLQVPTEQALGEILVSEFMLDGEPVESLDGRELSPDFNNISLSVSVPYFGQYYNLQLEYRLSSGLESWTRLPDNGVISFNRLSHGTYTLSVRMLKGFGSGEYITRNIEFTVAPHWYQTSLFYLSAILLMVLLSVLFVRWRTRNIGRQKQVLEKEVESRTAALKISEEKVRQNAQFKSQVTSLVLHDVRSPLYYLNKITGNIYQSTEGKVPENIREELKDLHLSVKDISAYAQTLFAWISAQQDDFILMPAKIHVAGLLEEICNNYQLLAAQNKNRISWQADTGLRVTTQADLLQIVIRNLVDNAIKFTNNGEIILSAVQKDGTVQITVKDNGKGMAADRVERILGKDSDEHTDTRSGMGYRLIRDLLKKMKGQLSVVSEQGKGSAITILLPLSPGAD